MRNLVRFYRNRQPLALLTAQIMLSTVLPGFSAGQEKGYTFFDGILAKSVNTDITAIPVSLPNCSKYLLSMICHIRIRQK